MSQHPAPSLLVTGTTGFIGKHVVSRLLDLTAGTIRCLVRGLSDSRNPNGHRIELVDSDLVKSADLGKAVLGTDTIIHMAGATGAASAAEMQRINVEATGRLVEAAAAAGVRRFVFVSSIAATGSAIDDYPYALSKRDAERLVAGFPGEHTILRPTIVLGAESPNWQTLRRLACLPLVPLIGGGGARIQPIAVDDVARGIVLVATAAEPPEPEIDLGGPEVLSFGEFLHRIRAACGLGRGFSVPVPAAPMRAGLKLAKQLLGEKFPVGPGQVAAFVNDGIARPGATAARLAADMAPLDLTLAQLCDAG